MPIIIPWLSCEKKKKEMQEDKEEKEADNEFGTAVFAADTDMVVISV